MHVETKTLRRACKSAGLRCEATKKKAVWKKYACFRYLRLFICVFRSCRSFYFHIYTFSDNFLPLLLMLFEVAAAAQLRKESEFIWK